MIITDYKHCNGKKCLNINININFNHSFTFDGNSILFDSPFLKK